MTNDDPRIDLACKAIHEAQPWSENVVFVDMPESYRRRVRENAEDLVDQLEKMMQDDRRLMRWQDGKLEPVTTENEIKDSLALIMNKLEEWHDRQTRFDARLKAIELVAHQLQRQEVTW